MVLLKQAEGPINIAKGCVVLLPTLFVILFREYVFGWMSAIFERNQREQDGAIIASLLTAGSPEVGDTWWIHDDHAYDKDPPRETKWYKGRVVHPHTTLSDVQHQKGRGRHSAVTQLASGFATRRRLRSTASDDGGEASRGQASRG